MNVGKFREVLTLYRRDPDGDAVDRYGRKSPRYLRVEDVRARAYDVSSRDYYEAAAHKLQEVVTFDTRWKSGIDSSWRVVWRDDAYEIDQVNHLGYRNDFVRLKCRKVENDGSVYAEE